MRPMSTLYDDRITKLEQENADLRRELAESLEYQTATSDVLKAISRSAFDLQPVLDTLIETAAVLCGANAATGIAIRQGDVYRHVAMFSHDPEWVARVKGTTFVPDRSTIGGRVALEGQVVHVTDLAADPEYNMPEAVTIGGMRTLLGVPLLREGEPIGVLLAGRENVQPFTGRQIELLRSFADQAVIAIENARLITETQEALDQQTATAEVLGVINASPGDLKPVFDAMVEKATRLCKADSGHLALPDGDDYRTAAVCAMSPEMEAQIRAVSYAPGRGTAVGRALLERRVVQIADIGADPEHSARHAAEQGLIRTILGVPLLRDGEPLGAFGLSRSRVEPFTDRQIDLVRNFAAQAVIAIENARLITETREALDQQTATAEVLQVINSSPGDLTPVFDAMLHKAMRLCEAAFGILFTLDGDLAFARALHNVPAEFSEYLAREPPRAGPGTLLGRVIVERAPLQEADILSSEPYRQRASLSIASAKLALIRTLLVVPLVKDDAVLGLFTVYRTEVSPFTDKQIALLQNFAAQAVIAMENARLLGELRQRTEEVAGLNRDLEARVAAQVDELGRVGNLKRFLPPQVAEMVVSQGDERILESHRREIVVVFCDVRGYTAFSETAEPEEVIEFLGEYHAALGPLITRFEGTLSHFLGDGLMVFFNDPVPCPDPAERAVKMAVAMREAAGRLVAAWRRRGHQMGFGAGVAQGYATLGQIGFADRSDYTAIGTVCNLAARLCGEAQDGQILVAQRVAAGLDGNIPLEDVGALTLRGLSQPVVAFNIIEAGGVASRLRLI
jgi:GAF domain-containing protein